MKENAELLLKTPLFEGIKEEELHCLMGCLGMRLRKYAKEETILQAGDAVRQLGVVKSGSVRVIREDALGNRTIVGELGAGEMFGETFPLARVERLPVSVTASADSEVLLLESKGLAATCSRSCACHTRLIENMMAILAQKNLHLNERLEVLSRRSTREKLLAYLKEQSQKTGSVRFTIPFNRQELADYLCVDRSAMSSELGKLQREGVLSVSRSTFVLRKALEPD